MIKAASDVAFRGPPLKTCTFHDTGWALISPPSASGKTVGMLLLPEVIGAGFLGAADWLFSLPWFTAGHRKYLGTLTLLHVGLGILGSCKCNLVLSLLPCCLLSAATASCMERQSAPELQKTCKEIP